MTQPAFALHYRDVTATVTWDAPTATLHVTSMRSNLVLTSTTTHPDGTDDPRLLTDLAAAGIIRYLDERNRAGQTNRHRRIALPGGRDVILSLVTGPPTWWAPRIIPRRRSLLIGWMRAGVAVAWRTRADATEDVHP